GNNQVLGLRFDSMILPPGSRILSARIDFYASDSDNAAISELTITGEASANPAPFVTGQYNISGRPDTSAVSWPNVPAWSSGNRYSTPDISTIVQQIVDGAGWARGNAMAFAISAPTLSGSNNIRRRAVSSEASTSRAPSLVITAEVPTARLSV